MGKTLTKADFKLRLNLFSKQSTVGEGIALNRLRCAQVIERLSSSFFSLITGEEMMLKTSMSWTGVALRIGEHKTLEFIFCGGFNRRRFG